jgi:galactose oxidase
LSVHAFDFVLISFPSAQNCCPDGRVYVAGGGKLAGFTDQRTVEIFSPPYLFRGQRPLITGMVSQLGNNQVRYGESFTVLTSNTTITRATLVRLPSATHSLNFNQRFNELSTVVKVAGGYRVTAPPNGKVCPPGHYYLHLINAAGVPSVATIIKVL